MWAFIRLGHSMANLDISAASQERLSTGDLPPGCRQADLERGVSRLDDLGDEELWGLLGEAERSAVYRDFFQRDWADLAECLEDHAESGNRVHNGASLGNSIRAIWIKRRDFSLRQMALAGQIRMPE